MFPLKQSIFLSMDLSENWAPVDPVLTIIFYHLVMTNIAMENHHAINR